MANNSPINLPMRPQAGMPITAEWARGLGESINRIIQTRTQNQGGFAPNSTPPPFTPYLTRAGTPESPTYQVDVTHGYVVEVTGDEVITHLPSNIMGTGDESDQPAKFTIESGQVLYVQVSLSSGVVGSVSLVVDDASKASTNDEHYYPLVELEVGDTTDLKNILSGSHIFYTKVNASDSSYPWKVTANGDATVSVFKGGGWYWYPDGDGFPFEAYLVERATGNFTVTASGTIYVVVACTEIPVNNFLDTWFGISGLSLELDPTPTGSNLYFPLAAVTLSSGVATVTAQYLKNDFEMR